MIVSIATANFNFFAVIFLTLFPEKGTERIAPVMTNGANLRARGFSATRI